MSTYCPGSWAIISIDQEDGTKLYKVAAGWSGSYLEGASWKVSSGITRVSETSQAYEFDNYSGSRYICSKGRYGLHWYAASIIEGYCKEAESIKRNMRVLDEEEALELIKGWK